MYDHEYCEGQLTALKKDRGTRDAHFKELRDFTTPASGRFDGEKNDDLGKRYGKLLNTKPYLARRIMASGMHAGITSPARPWFTLSTNDPGLMEYGPVKNYLYIVERLLRQIFSKSNLYKSLPKLYGELGTFATSAMAVTPNFNSVLFTQPYTIGTYWIGSNDDGKVDTFYRTPCLKVRQIVEMAGRYGGKVSRSVQNLYDRGQYWDDVPCVHAVMPNRDHKPGSIWAKDKPFIGLLYERSADGKRDFIMMQGYDYFPVLVPRWDLNDGDTWGNDCPGMAALADAKQIQSQERRKAKAIANSSDPALQAPSAGDGKNIQPNILPGTTTFYNSALGGDGIKRIFNNDANISHLLEDIAKTEGRIDQTYYADLFLMLTLMDRRDITAREIDERSAEKLLMLGPVLEQLNTDLLNPLIDLGFAYGNSQGVFPPPPPELAGQDLKVEYISILAQAQHAAGLSAIERQIVIVGNLAQASGDVTVWDKVNKDQIVDETSQMLGVSPTIINSDEQVALIREARAQAQAQAMAAEQAKTMAEAVKTGAQASQVQQETGFLPGAAA